MRFFFFLFFVLECKLAMAQVDFSKYKIDTTFVPSETNGQVLDTVFVVTKIETIVKRVLVETGPSIKFRNTIFLLGASRNFMFNPTPVFRAENIQLSVFQQQKQGFVIGFLIPTTNKWNFAAKIGFDRLEEKGTIETTSFSQKPHLKVFTDTLDAYYVENEEGIKEPHLITKIRNELSIITTENIQTTRFQNTYYFFLAQIGCAKSYAFKKWQLLPAIELQGEFQLSQKLENEEYKATLPQIAIVPSMAFVCHYTTQIGVFTNLGSAFYLTNFYPSNILFARKSNALITQIGITFKLK